MADGAFKKTNRKENRMLILLNLLVNCHLRNASFGYFLNLN